MKYVVLVITYAFAFVYLACAPAWSQNTSSEENVSVPIAQLEALRQQIDDMKAEIEALKEQIMGLQQQDALQAEKDAIYESEVIGGASSSGVPQTLLPDISVTGNIVGKASSDENDEDRNNVILREAEVAFQGYLYPQIRGDLIVAMEEEADHDATIEEGYISFLQIGNTDLSSQLGKMRLDFGKVNPIHPHHWPYVDPPLVVRNFLTSHGFLVEGVNVGCLLPSIGGLFSNIEVGVWQAKQHTHEHEDEHEVELEEDHDAHEHSHFGPGFDDRVYSGRLWNAIAISDDSELEVGASVAHGTGLREDLTDRDSITLSGVDLTYKRWPAAHKRLLFQGEAMLHRRAGINSFGYYLFGNYKWSKYWDAGLRYDWSERPFPGDGHDSGVSAILTNHLTETTKLRLQYSLEDQTHKGRVHEAFFQIIWGIGPHSHPLE